MATLSLRAAFGHSDSRYYAFTTMHAHHVISVIHPENRQSIRVAEKIGERFEREHDFDGNPTLIYGITR